MTIKKLQKNKYDKFKNYFLIMKKQLSILFLFLSLTTFAQEASLARIDSLLSYLNGVILTIIIIQMLHLVQMRILIGGRNVM